MKIKKTYTKKEQIKQRTKLFCQHKLSYTTENNIKSECDNLPSQSVKFTAD